MKLSRFNIWSLSNQGLILFNTLTCALALFEDENAKKLLSILERNSPTDIPEEYAAAMLEDGYLVADDVNELEAVTAARLDRQSRVDEYSLCVILTMTCNFKCFYCFEKHRDEHLAESEANKVEAMIRNISKSAKKIDLDWFGGEPLVSFKALRVMNDKFMRITKDNGVEYRHSITTNGYLLTKDVISYLTQTPLSVITVTLDGPPSTHDVARPLRGGGQTFWVIMENIQNAVAAGLKVDVRVNVTTKNVDKILELYDILEERGLKNRVGVNLQAVVSSPANPCDELCFTGYDFAHKAMEIYKKAAQKGWIVLPPTEKMKALGFCVGEYPNRLMTDLHGNFYRCPQMFETSSVGTLGKDGTVHLDQVKNDLWVKKDPLHFAECWDCAVLPICMGGCNMKRHEGRGSDYCLDWKHNIPGFLEVLILNEENISRVNEATV